MTYFVASPPLTDSFPSLMSALWSYKRDAQKAVLPQWAWQDCLADGGKVAVPDLKNYGQPVVDLENLSPNVRVIK